MNSDLGDLNDRVLSPCSGCDQGESLGFEIKMAFQPIVDARSRDIFGYEALVRSADGGGAQQVLAQVEPDQLYRFDQTCRVKAIQTAAELGLDRYLSINFLPNAVYEPATCIRLTLQAAAKYGFPVEKLIFETAESEQVRDELHLMKIFQDYRKRGFLTAVDDFGAGYAGLKLLAGFQPDLIKIDIALISEIQINPAKQAIVRGIFSIANELGCLTLAEGVETAEEFRFLHVLGIRLYQGFYFGKPQLEQLGAVPDLVWAALDTE